VLPPMQLDDCQKDVRVIELGRPDPRDGRVVETSPLLAYMFASNSNVQLLGGEDACQAVSRYVVSYCAKNPVQLASVVSTIGHVMKEVARGDLEGTPCDDHTRFLKRLINSLDKKVEVSAQMAALSLMGYPSWHASHKFVVVDWEATRPAFFQCIPNSLPRMVGCLVAFQNQPMALRDEPPVPLSAAR